MDSANLNSKNIVKNIGIFLLIMLSLIIIPRKNIGMNNVSYEKSCDEQNFFTNNAGSIPPPKFPSSPCMYE